MERYIIDKRTGITYELVGDYYLPIDFPVGRTERAGSEAAPSAPKEPRKDHAVAIPETTDRPAIGRFGRAHELYLKQNQRHVYSQLVSKGKLGAYLAQIDEQANSMLELLICQMAEREGVTEQLKVADQMEWVRRMNNIRSRAEEIINSELIFT